MRHRDSVTTATLEKSGILGPPPFYWETEAQHWSLELHRDLLNEYLERNQGDIKVLKLFRKEKKEGSEARRGEAVTTSWSPAGKVCLMVVLCLIHKV